MSLALDLLVQAQHLVELDLRRPKQVNLRRSASAAYYSLFHLLAGECAKRVAPKRPASLTPRIARSLGHADMKEVCQQVAKLNAGPVMTELMPGGFSLEIKTVATAFVALQTARHLADYDLSAVFTRPDTTDLIDQTRRAFENWRRVRNSEEANVFLAALAFGKRWAK